jgi:hypothetical protein
VVFHGKGFISEKRIPHDVHYMCTIVLKNLWKCRASVDTACSKKGNTTAKDRDINT